MKSCRDCHYLPLSEVTTSFVAELDYVTYLYKALVLLNQIQGSLQKKKNRCYYTGSYGNQDIIMCHCVGDYPSPFL
jgi:sialic acid synthase SpsE